MSNKSLPTVSSAIPRDLKAWVNRVTDFLTTGGNDRIARFSDLLGTGAFNTNSSGSLITQTDTGTLGTPPAPTNFSTTGAMTSVICEWDGTGYPGHSYTEIWRADSDDLSLAVEVGQAGGVSEIYQDAVGSDASNYYWVRFVNTDGNPGPFNATAGTLGETAPDLAYVMSILSEEYGAGSEAPFFQLDAPTMINGVEIPAGTYMKTAFIHEAMIESAMIYYLSADKITVGEMSGARISANSLDANTFITNTLAAKLAQITTAYIENAHLNGAIIQSANIVSLDAAKVNATTLSSIVADIGTITAGRLQSSDGNMYIDLDDKEIYIA